MIQTTDTEPDGRAAPYVTEVFARYAARFQRQALPGHVLHHAKRAVIDWYASLYPGLGAPAVLALEDVLGR